MGNDRFTRPHVARTDPIRSFWTIFGGPGDPPAGSPDPITRGVEAGYRVIEDYLRRGRESARTRAPGAPAPPDADPVQARMLSLARLLTEAASTWMDVLGVGPSAPPGAPAGAPGPFASTGGSDEPAADPAARSRGDDRPGPEDAFRSRGSTASPAPPTLASATALELILAGPPRVRVSLYLRGRAHAGPLRTSELRADPDANGAAAPPIRGVELVHAGGDEPLELRLPGLDAHAPGCYRGVIVDERTSVTAGTLTLVVGAHEA